jgi:hypothetical protein
MPTTTTTCPKWCTGACAHTGRCVSEWSTTKAADGVGTVRLRRAGSAVEVEAGATLAANAVTIDMASARVLYYALGRIIHAT